MSYRPATLRSFRLATISLVCLMSALAGAILARGPEPAHAPDEPTSRSRRESRPRSPRSCTARWPSPGSTF